MEGKRFFVVFYHYFANSQTESGSGSGMINFQTSGQYLNRNKTIEAIVKALQPEHPSKKLDIVLTNILELSEKDYIAFNAKI